MWQNTIIILAVSVLSQTYLSSALVIRDNVIFHKTNEVSISRAKWLLSIVIDFDDFEHFMSLVDEDIKQAEAVISITIPKQDMVEYEAFRNALAGLRQEIKFLKELKISIKTEVEQIMRMHDYNPSRTKRSLLPFIGEGLSWLFGIVTGEDLSQIRHQISLLSRNQKQVIHVVEQTLSIVNESRVFVKENRQSIISITKSIQEMDSKFNRMKHELEQKIYENRRFMEIFSRLNLVLDEIKTLVRDAKFYLFNLQAQLDALAVGKVSFRTMNPLRLRRLLMDIQENTPGFLSLICDPKKDLWLYYRYLKGTTYFWNGKIIVVLSIPMIRKDQQYEVYKAISIPVPPPVPINGSQKFGLLATYRLEANGFLIDKARKNYLLLTDSQIDTCSKHNFQFCNVPSAVYPVGISKSCIINLFMNANSDVALFCTAEVTKVPLPMTQYLFDVHWLVLSRTHLTFALVCLASNQELKSQPPFSIISVQPGCTASNRYFTINAPLVVGRSNTSKENTLDLVYAYFSKITVWKHYQEKFSNNTKINVPPALSEIENIPLNSLLRELELAKVVDPDVGLPWSVWPYVTLSLALVVVFIIILYCCKYDCARKSTCLPEWLRNVWRIKQKRTVPTEVELQTRESGGSMPPAVPAKDTADYTTNVLCSRIFGTTDTKE